MWTHILFCVIGFLLSVGVASAEFCRLDSDCRGDGGTGSVCCNGNCQKLCVRRICPRPYNSGACVSRCQFDSQCPDGQICCSNGCGHVCRQPIYVSEQCPCASHSRGVLTACRVKCESDAACPQDKKCCSYGCSKICRDPMQVLLSKLPATTTTTPATNTTTTTTGTTTTTTTATTTTEPTTTTNSGGQKTLPSCPSQPENYCPTQCYSDKYCASGTVCCRLKCGGTVCR